MKRLLPYLLLALSVPVAMLVAQPAPDTRPVPQAQQLRDVADYVEQTAQEKRDLTDLLQREQARSSAFQKEIDRLVPLAWVTWTPATVFVPGTTYGVRGGQAVNIVVDKPGVTLKMGQGFWCKGSRPGLTILASRTLVLCDPTGLTFDAPPSVLDRPDNRLRADGGDAGTAMSECIRVASDGPTGVPIKGVVIVDASAGRANALAKAYPDADGVQFIRPRSTNDLRADGVYFGGSKNGSVIDAELTAKNENTVRWTAHKGIVAERGLVRGGNIRNTGGKAAVEFRNLKGGTCVDATLFATRNNSAVGIGHAHDGDPGADDCLVSACTITGGSITVHDTSRGVTLLEDVFAWPGTQDNSAVSINATVPGTVRDVVIGGLLWDSPVPQKAMIGVMGGAQNVVNYYDRGDNGAKKTPATQPTTQPVR